MSVDFPAPFGPSSPMERPRNSPVRSSSTMRLPSRTSNPLSSMMPMSLSYAGAGSPVPGMDQRGKSQKVKSEKLAVTGAFNVIVFPPNANRRGPRIRCHLADGLRCLAAELGKEGSQNRADVLVHDGGIVSICVYRKERFESFRTSQRIAAVMRLNRL